MSKTIFEGFLRDVRWTSWGLSESTSRGRPLDVSLKRPLDVIFKLPQDSRSGRLQDGQIGSLGDVLETLDGDILDTNICRLECSFLRMYFRRSQIQLPTVKHLFLSMCCNSSLVAYFYCILNLPYIFIVLITDIFHVLSNIFKPSIYSYRCTYFCLITIKAASPL